MISQLNILHYSVTAVVLFGIIGAILYFKKNNNKKNKLKVKLIEKNYITHDTAIFTFLLPSSRKSLGLKVG